MKTTTQKSIIITMLIRRSPPPLIHFQSISIDDTIQAQEACKQRNQSVYVLFLYLWKFFQSFFYKNARYPPFTLRVTVKGDKTRKLTSFQKKGGETHETIFFSRAD